MKIGIIGAMEKEVANLIHELNDLTIINKQHLTFHLGKLKGCDVIIVASGIGKVATGMIIATMVNYFPGIDKIINVGVSGGVFGKVVAGDVVIGDKYSYADVNIPSLSFGQLPNMPQVYQADQEMLKVALQKDGLRGAILTGDKFFVDKNEVDTLLNSRLPFLDIYAFDMESTAFAQACYIYEIPFLAIRAISDVIGGENQEQEYYNCVEMACARANEILINILENLKQ